MENHAKVAPGKRLTEGLAGFLLGIFLFGLFDRFGAIAPFIAVLLIGLSALRFREARHFLASTLFLAGLLFGGVIFSWQISHAPVDLEEESALIEATVIKVSAGDEQRIVLSALLVDGQEKEGKIQIYTPPFPELFYGDRLRFRCFISPPKPLEDFRYDRFLRSQGMIGTCFLSESPMMIAQKTGNPVFQAVHKIRHAVIERLNHLYGEPQASLLVGLYFGEQRFSDLWEERFRITGTTHIIAASGYNVSLVAYLLFTFCIACGLWRKQAFFLVLFGIAVYAILASLDPPIVRASLMGALVLLARQIGRKTRMDNIILLSIACMLVLEPRLLVDHVGFQLSLAATVALIYFTPLIEPHLRFVPETYGIREGFSATLVATLATLPISLLTFKSISVLAPLANLFVLPLIPYIMLVAAIPLFLPAPIASFFTFPAHALMHILFSGIRALAAIPLMYFEISRLLALSILLAMSIFTFILWKNKRNDSSH